MIGLPAIFLFTPDEDPYANMALDNWCFDKLDREDRDFAEVLRLYSWARPAITLGCNQDPRKVVDWSLLPAELPVIRRVTGGRAIYHDNAEITFSLVGSLHLFPENGRSLKSVNLSITKTVVGVLEALGLRTAWQHNSEPEFRNNGIQSFKSCFSSMSRYEIAADGLKVVGGAQRRQGEKFIHQGSIKINGVSECEAIGQKKSPAPAANFHTIADFAKEFAENFSKNLGLGFVPYSLNADEKEQWQKAAEDLKRAPLAQIKF
ncbi:putative Octanoyltransferase LipM [Candidatus Zixiibacteriota bacterium]|nr:putative Octanoyltransferase LipM [candidate division Zixibacteria bacterium]